MGCGHAAAEQVLAGCHCIICTSDSTASVLLHNPVLLPCCCHAAASLQAAPPLQADAHRMARLLYSAGVSPLSLHRGQGEGKAGSAELPALPSSRQATDQLLACRTSHRLRQGSALFLHSWLAGAQPRPSALEQPQAHLSSSAQTPHLAPSLPPAWHCRRKSSCGKQARHQAGGEGQLRRKQIACGSCKQPCHAGKHCWAAGPATVAAVANSWRTVSSPAAPPCARS